MYDVMRQFCSSVVVVVVVLQKQMLIHFAKLKGLALPSGKHINFKFFMLCHFLTPV